MRGLVAGIVLVSVACSGTPSNEPGPIEAVVRFPDAGAELRVEVADSTDEYARGLMGRTELPPDGGMVFLFDQPIQGNFVMRDTLIPLSIAFWDEGGRIVQIMEMVPCEAEPCRSYTPSAPYVAAVETSAGWFRDHGIRAGDPVEVRRT